MTAPSCTTCDFMRYINDTMRCFWDAPTPTLIAVIPNRITGAPPIPVVTGISPEVSPDQFCRHHLALRPDDEVKASPGRPDVSVAEIDRVLPRGSAENDIPRGGLILPPGAGETRQ